MSVQTFFIHNCVNVIFAP